MPPPEARAQSARFSLRTAALLFAAVILLWGVNWPVMKIGLESIPPFHFALARMLLGGLTMFAVAAMVGQLRLPSRHDLPVVLSVGLLQMGAFTVLVTWGLEFVGAGRAAILAYTTPIWVVPLSLLTLRERLPGLKRLGLLLGLGGVAVLFNPFGFDWSDHHVLLGNGLLLLGALVWAVLIVQIRGHRWEGTPLSLAPWQFSVAMLLLAPLALVVEHDAPIRWSTELVLVLAYNGPIATAFCFWAMISVTRALPAVSTSLGSLGVPVVGMMSAAWWLGEPLTPTNTGGLLLVLAGLGAVAMADARSRAAAR